MSPGRKIFSVVMALFFLAAAVMELFMQMGTEDSGMRTFHRVGFFGFLILSSLEWIWMKVSEPIDLTLKVEDKDKAT
jgi:hypothetical protein